MEAALNMALAVAMRLDDTMRMILCANLQLRDKLNILRTIVDSSSMTEDAKEQFKAGLQKVSDYSWKRNMMAHDNFSLDEKGLGVLFHQIKAKGKLSQP